jgi:hypothetical protein
MIKIFKAMPVLLLAGAPALVSAQETTARQELEMFARAEPACVARAPVAAAGVNATFDPSSDAGGEVRIIQLVDNNSAEPLPASITLLVPVVCNSSHRVALRSQNGGLLRDAGNPQIRQSSSGFGEFLPYEYAFGWAGQQRESKSDEARTMSFDVARGAAGEASFSFSLAGGGGPLLAGRYSDSIIIEFQPAN